MSCFTRRCRSSSTAGRARALAEAPLDTMVLVKVRVAEHRKPEGRYSKGPYRVLVEDDTGDALLVFFLANIDWIERSLPIGATRWVSGKLELYDGHRQIVHPDRILDEAGLARLPPVEAAYALTEGLQQRQVRGAVDRALEKLPKLPEWQNASVLAAHKLGGFAECLERLHHPQEPADIAPTSPARQRLALDELLAQQLALRLLRSKMRRPPGREHKSAGRLAQAIEAALPFALTRAQRRALDDIHDDLASDRRMLRLLQGDVGSGKTIVAALAMAEVIEVGRQTALMAPTEILARQHYEKLHPLFRAQGVETVLLTGRAKSRRTRYLACGRGEGKRASCHRHACAHHGRSRLSGSGSRGRRRAAPIWRRTAIGAGRQRRGGRHAGDDGDPHPALARVDAVWRHG